MVQRELYELGGLYLDVAGAGGDGCSGGEGGICQVFRKKSPNFQLNFTLMDIQYEPECKHDMLQVSEGEDRHAIIRNYCYEQDTEDYRIVDRQKIIKSRDRTLTLYFHTDATITKRGFAVNWEFTRFGNGSKRFLR